MYFNYNFQKRNIEYSNLNDLENIENIKIIIKGGVIEFPVQTIISSNNRFITITFKVKVLKLILLLLSINIGAFAILSFTKSNLFIMHLSFVFSIITVVISNFQIHSRLEKKLESILSIKT
jgi:hypothetical protein